MGFQTVALLLLLAFAASGRQLATRVSYSTSETTVNQCSTVLIKSLESKMAGGYIRILGDETWPRYAADGDHDVDDSGFFVYWNSVTGTSRVVLFVSRPNGTHVVLQALASKMNGTGTPLFLVKIWNGSIGQRDSTPSQDLEILFHLELDSSTRLHRIRSNNTDRYLSSDSQGILSMVAATNLDSPFSNPETLFRVEMIPDCSLRRACMAAVNTTVSLHGGSTVVTHELSQLTEC